MNAYKRYFQRLMKVERAGEYVDSFDENFDKFYKGEGDHDEDAAAEAFFEAAATMEMDGVIDDSTKI